MSNRLVVKHLSPFKKEEITINVSGEEEIIQVFKEIQWYDYIIKIFSFNQSPKSKDEKYIYNDYHCYSISKGGEESKKIIYFVPNYASNFNFKEEDIRFFIEYMRPKKVKTSKFSRLFGAPEDKIKGYLTHCKEVKIDEAVRIMRYFINGEETLLDKEISIKGSYY